MKYFWVTRDEDGCTIWEEEPYLNEDGLYVSMHGKTLSVFEDLDEELFYEFFGLTPKMNECKKVTLRLEVVE